MKPLLIALIALLANVASSPLLSVQGRVRDEAGRGVSGAIVSLKSATVDRPLTTVSSRDGRYEFLVTDAVADYEIRADSGKLSSPVRTLRLVNGAASGIDLVVGTRIRFEDVAAKAGLGFVLHNGATGHLYQPEIMLGGIAALDYNNDGCMDIFVTNGATLPAISKSGSEYFNRLYRNNCDLTFTDVTASAGLTGSGYSMGVAAADYDNDGFVDILATGLTGNTLYRNRGNGTFEDVTTRALGDSTARWSVSAGWFDFDNDGYLDLFITSYVEWSAEAERPCVAGESRLYCHPRMYQGAPNRLYRNNHDGTFTDVSQTSGISVSIGKAMGVAFGDFNDDGLTDVFVTNDSVPNFLFQNLGNGKFKEVALTAGVAYNAPGNAIAGMGADFRDFDEDGREDIALDGMYYDGFTLYRNQGLPHYFSDATLSSGLAKATSPLTGWGMGMFDFDNDGAKDLFYATSHFPGSEPFVHVPAATPNQLLRNIGDGRFEDVSSLAGPNFQLPAMNRGVAFADFDNDGRIDAAVTAIDGHLKLFRNISPETGHWLGLTLIGTKSNRQGLGAKIRLTWPTGRRLYNRATTAVGYASSSEPTVRFGLGPYESAAEIEIRWPSGQTQLLTNIKADRFLKITEPRPN